MCISYYIVMYYFSYRNMTCKVLIENNDKEVNASRLGKVFYCCFVIEYLFYKVCVRCDVVSTITINHI